MNTKRFIIVFLVCFVGLCGFLIYETGLFNQQGQTSNGVIALANPSFLEAAAESVGLAGDEFDLSNFRAERNEDQIRRLGSLDPDTGYEFGLEITNKGAGIRSVTYSRFDDRDPDEPENLQVLSPVESSGKYLYSLANGNFDLLEQKKRIGLGGLNWRFVEGASERKVSLELVLKENSGKDAIRFVKTYSIERNSFQIDCQLTVENLSDQALKTKFDMQGPVGINREGTRADMRKAVSAYVLPDGSIESVSKDVNKLRKYLTARSSADKQEAKEELQLKHDALNARFVWASISNKYFAAIIHPVETVGTSKERFGTSQYFDPDIAEKKPSKDVNVGITLRMDQVDLSEAGQAGAKKDFGYSLYVGPKDRSVFDENELYSKLEYFQTIDFRSCFCCPSAIIHPLAFGIMGFMKWMYTAMGPLGNYGVVIMVLVFLVRLVMHPLTKKGQVSMMSMQKISSHPRMEEIKRKYANNKAELQKQTMQFYKDQGVSPAAGAMGMMPMMLQMPVWIALWTSINISFELRGAEFLPFWITDLSVPDALIPFKAINLPIFGEISSFNLLPILMGVVMYFQQKLMPHSSAAANPQAAQQQKMMQIMMPLMFPIMLYKGPSGVNLYILSSITAGVFEQMIIRKHIREKEEDEGQGLVAVTSKTGGKVKKKKPKPFYKG